MKKSNNLLQAYYVLSKWCTVAANKKFPFRFRGTPVQRLAVDKKTVIRQYSPWARATLLFFNITKTSPITTSTVGSQTVARRHRSFRLADSRITVFYPRRSVVRPCHGNGTGTFYWRLLYTRPTWKRQLESISSSCLSLTLNSHGSLYTIKSDSGSIQGSDHAA